MKWSIHRWTYCCKWNMDGRDEFNSFLVLLSYALDHPSSQDPTFTIMTAIIKLIEISSYPWLTYSGFGKISDQRFSSNDSALLSHSISRDASVCTSAVFIRKPLIGFPLFFPFNHWWISCYWLQHALICFSAIKPSLSGSA